MKFLLFSCAIFCVFLEGRTQDAVDCSEVEDATLVPHEICSMFYICTDGDAIEADCPPTMWFDPDISNCAIDNDNRCVDGTTSTTEGPTTTEDPTTTTTEEPITTTTTEEPITTTTENPTTTTDAEDTTTEPPVTDPPTTTTVDPGVVSCPIDNIDTDIYLPNPDSCTTYFYCCESTPVLMECRSGLFWNQEERVCDFSDNVVCDDDTTTMIPTTSDPNQLPDCPEDGVSFMAHPTDCRLYLFCFHGQQTIQQCTFLTYWHHLNNECVVESEVECYPGAVIP